MKSGSLVVRRLCAALGTAGLLVTALGAAATVPAWAAPLEGVISGAVDADATGAPIAGVCVYATGVTGQPGYWVAAGPEYESSTVGTGAYELRVPVGTYVLRFDPSCGRTLPSPYAVQYYLGQVDLERADAVSVSATSPATGINALLATGFSLSGAVTGSEAPNGLANVCVSAVDAATATVGRATTSTNGTFTIANLPAGSYWVHFDPTCGGARKSHYAAQYYPGQAWPTTTAELAVGADVTGVDAQLVNGGSLSGTVTAAGAANNTGICVAAVGAGGDVTGLGITSQTGWYEITNLAAGNYRVTIDPTCNGSQASYFSAEDYGHTISVAAGHAYSGINVTVALQYGPPLSITLASLPAGKVYSSYFADLSMAGPSTEESDYAWHVTGLPRGLYPSSSSLSEAIAGRPQIAGHFVVTTTVSTDGAVPPLVVSRTFHLVVEPASPNVSVSSSSAKLSGHHVLVGLECHEAACTGKASVLAPTGAVLASGHYSMAQGAKEPVVLTLSTNGARALAQAWNHPVGEKLLVTVSRGVAATSMVQVSWGGR